VRAHRPSISHSIEHPHARITLPGMASRPIRSEASMQLVLSHITYTYPGSSEPALCDVSVTFPQGWTGIVGDNGGGKTTLARVAGFRLACQGDGSL
jgi:ABC-type bacteriocin/lantibiotic exporter with double-glycine peptidase domain